MAVMLGVGYFLLGLIQMVAVMYGAHAWWHLGHTTSFLLALILAYIPVLGTIAGIVGAHAGFGWGWGACSLLFLWPYALWLLVICRDAIAKRRAW
jgi:hypothetical protein